MPICACAGWNSRLATYCGSGLSPALTLVLLGTVVTFVQHPSYVSQPVELQRLITPGIKFPHALRDLGAVHCATARRGDRCSGPLGFDCDARDACGDFDPRVHLPGRSNLHADYERGAMPATVVAGARKSRVTKPLHPFRSPQREQGFLPPRPLLALRASIGRPDQNSKQCRPSLNASPTGAGSIVQIGFASIAERKSSLT